MTGRAIGRVIFLFNTERRRVCYANLRAAFCSEKAPHEIYSLTRAVFQNLSAVISEIMCLAKVDKAYVDRYVTVENIERVDAAYNKGKGVILLTAHFGNWEFSSIVGAFKGYQLHVLAREQKMKRLNALLDKLRESKGAKVVRKGITTRSILKALHDGCIIGMLADQSAGSNGVMARFFGRLASTADGPYRFAEKTGAVIVPVFTMRTYGPYTRIVVEETMEIPKGADVLSFIRRYNGMLEKYVRAYTDQWLWIHRRWKLCPEKKIVVLSDGKQGHLNQSLSLADLFSRYRAVKNLSGGRTDIEVIDVRYKNKLWKALLTLWSASASVRCQGCLKCLKYGLASSSYEKLEKTFADVVISSGFSLAGVNKIFSIENNAKNAVCMRPGLLSLKKFNMVVLARHDAGEAANGRNVIVTDSVPNLVRAEGLEKAAEELLRNCKKEHKSTIGVLIGGDNQAVSYSPGDIDKVLGGVIEAARLNGADVLVTTSRRTSALIESAAKKRLAGEPLCKLLIIANENNPPYAVNGILGASGVVVVSGESVSMVSEAVSSGRPVVVFEGTPKTNKPTKFGYFLKRLEENKCIRRSSPEHVGEAVTSALKSPMRADPSYEKDIVYLNMWRLGA